MQDEVEEMSHNNLKDLVLKMYEKDPALILDIVDREKLEATTKEQTVSVHIGVCVENAEKYPLRSLMWTNTANVYFHCTCKYTKWFMPKIHKCIEK